MSTAPDPPARSERPTEDAGGAPTARAGASVEPATSRPAEPAPAGGAEGPSDAEKRRELWRELKRRASMKPSWPDADPGQATEAQAAAREKAVGLRGEVRKELAGRFERKTQYEIFTELWGDQARNYGLSGSHDPRRPGLERRHDVHEIDRLVPRLAEVHLRTDAKEHLLRRAAAVVLLVKKDDLELLPDGRYRLKKRTFGEEYNLCKRTRPFAEPFQEQPIAGFATGVLVGEDLIATAGHCLRPGSKLRDTRFVFGFEMKDATTAVVELFPSQVHEAEGFVGGGPVEDPVTRSDWAVVKLRKSVSLEGVEPVPIRRRRDGKLEPGAPVYVIGHPCGLPRKIAPGGAVTHDSAVAYFKATLDVFGGSAGSPVFNEDHELEGIVAFGQPDFTEVWCGQCRRPPAASDWCRRSLIYPAIAAGDIDEEGEWCTRVSELERALETG